MKKFRFEIEFCVFKNQRKAPIHYTGCEASDKHFVENQLDFWCGATLINHRWIITGKLCLQFVEHKENCLVKTSEDELEEHVQYNRIIGV